MPVSEPIVQVIAHTKLCVSRDELAQLVGLECFPSHQATGSEPAQLIEFAGRVCYDSYGTGRSSDAYHAHIKDVGHGSVTEHVSLTFFISNISRGCSHELVRHRAGCAISQRSTRYVDESESAWVIHPVLDKLLRDHGDDDSAESLRAALEHQRQLSQRLYDHIVAFVQRHFEDAGVSALTARKQARGAARGVLGNALSTTLVWTANIRALRNFIELRASQHADAEIRVLANKIYEAALGVCPEYFNDYKKIPCPDGIGYELVTQHRKI